MTMRFWLVTASSAAAALLLAGAAKVLWQKFRYWRVRRELTREWN